MASQRPAHNSMEIDRLATQLAKDPKSKAFLPLAEEYCKVGMWEEAVSVLEDGLKYYPGFITAMVVLGRAYDQINQATKARAVLEGAVKLSPENLRAHRTLIKIYAAQGLRQEAMNSCRVILAVNPKDEEALSVQASLGVPERAPAGSLTTPPDAPALSPHPHTVKDSNHGSSDASAEASLPAPPAQDASATGPQGEALYGRRTTTSGPNAGEHQGASRVGDTVARLESWLRSLQQRRRDQPTDKLPEGKS